MTIFDKRQKIPLTCEGKTIGYVDMDSVEFWKETTDLASKCGVTFEELTSAYSMLTNDSMKPMDVKKAYERIRKAMEKIIKR